MQYFSLDLETLRISPKSPEGILMASFVFENTKKLEEFPNVTDLPHFTCLIDHGDSLPSSSRIAMAMNAWVLLAIEYGLKKQKGKADPVSFQKMCEQLGIPLDTVKKAIDAGEKYPVVTLDQFVTYALRFINNMVGEKDHITIAGKNAAMFDFQFLPASLKERIRHRVLDPGSLFIDWENDSSLPSSEKVKERANLSGVVSHDALDDARDVISILRTTYTKKIF